MACGAADGECARNADGRGPVPIEQVADRDQRAKQEYSRHRNSKPIRLHNFTSCRDRWYECLGGAFGQECCFFSLLPSSVPVLIMTVVTPPDLSGCIADHFSSLRVVVLWFILLIKHSTAKKDVMTACGDVHNSAGIKSQNAIITRL